MIIIRLHGHLKKLFGEVFKFEAKTIKEGIRALDCNIPSFRRELIKDDRKYHIIVNDTEDYADPNKIYFPLSTDSVVDIVPEFEGGGFSLKSALMVIAGVLLVIYAPALIMGMAAQAAGGSFVAGVAGAAAAGSAATTAALASFGAGYAAAASAIGYLGVSLATMGIASMLAPDPASDNSGAGVKSTSLSGTENITGQGSPVPIGYGRMLCGTNVISFITASNLQGYWPATSTVSGTTGRVTDIYEVANNEAGISADSANNTTGTTNENNTSTGTHSGEVNTTEEDTANVTTSLVDYSDQGGGLVTYKDGTARDRDNRVIP